MGQVPDPPIFYLEFSVGAALLFLQFWADPAHPDSKFADGDKPLPEIFASFPNKVTFSWITNLLSKGWKRPLTQDDLYDLKPSERCVNVSERWRRNWGHLRDSNRLTKV